MFEATLEAQALDNNERRFRSLSTAIIAHATFISAIVVVTAMIVPDVTTPEPRPIIVGPFYDHNRELAEQKHDPPPPAGPKRPTSANHAVAPVVPRPIEQPTETPQHIVEVAPSEGPEFEGDGTDGDPDSDSRGIPGSTGRGVGEGDDNGHGNGAALDVDPQPLTGDMVRPVLISKVEPVYPKSARLARLEGRVVLEAVVGLDGRIESVVVLSSSNGMFDEAAQTAVRKWVYTPAKMNGSPVRIYFTVQVSFTLR